MKKLALRQPPFSRRTQKREREREIVRAAMAEDVGEFYVRYYVGHKGKFGHEFLEFEFRPDGKLRYANNSNYKNDTMIRKEVFLTQAALRECRRIISDSEVGFFCLFFPKFFPFSDESSDGWLCACV